MASLIDTPDTIPLAKGDNLNQTSYSDLVSVAVRKSFPDLTTVPEKIIMRKPDHLVEDEFYNKWRPRYHLMPYRSWINDPCGPCYSSLDGGYYHMSFQWNPHGWEWGNMSWGHAISRDQVHWEVSARPSIDPSGDGDSCGVFTGCTWPTNPRGIADGTMTSFYTSAQRTPIHWTLPYQKDSELIRMATSEDHGATWERSPIHSLVLGPPEGVDVTGWRDPFVSPWESVDRCLGRQTGEHVYGVVAGGVRGWSPTVFLYDIDRQDLTRWRYLCMMFSPGVNFSPSPRLPDFGTNWEVVNFMALRDNLGNCHDILVMGAEGVLPRKSKTASSVSPPQSSTTRSRSRSPTPSPSPSISSSPCFSQSSGEVVPRIIKARRVERAQNWICAQVVKTQQMPDDSSHCDSDNKQQISPVALEYRFGGCLDFGCFYAANSFYDPVADERIVYGWVLEEDLPASLTAKQKWSGLLSIPRVLKMKCIPNVVGCSSFPLSSSLLSTSHLVNSHLQIPDWIHSSPSADGASYTVTTLTSSPDPRLSALRRNERVLGNLPVTIFSRNHQIGDDNDATAFPPSTIAPGSPDPLLLSFDTSHLEVQMSLFVPSHVEQIGLELYLSPGNLTLSFLIPHCVKKKKKKDNEEVKKENKIDQKLAKTMFSLKLTLNRSPEQDDHCLQSARRTSSHRAAQRPRPRQWQAS